MLHNRLPQALPTHHLTISVNPASRHSLAGSSAQRPARPPAGCQLGCTFTQRLNCGRESAPGSQGVLAEFVTLWLEDWVLGAFRLSAGGLGRLLEVTHGSSPCELVQHSSLLHQASEECLWGGVRGPSSSAWPSPGTHPPCQLPSRVP